MRVVIYSASEAIQKIAGETCDGLAMLLTDQFVFGRESIIRRKTELRSCSLGLSIGLVEITVQCGYRVILKRHPRKSELPNSLDVGGRVDGDKDLDYQFFERRIGQNQLGSPRAT